MTLLTLCPVSTVGRVLTLLTLLHIIDVGAHTRTHERPIRDNPSDVSVDPATGQFKGFQPAPRGESFPRAPERPGTPARPERGATAGDGAGHGARRRAVLSPYEKTPGNDPSVTGPTVNRWHAYQCFTLTTRRTAP